MDGMGVDTMSAEKQTMIDLQQVSFQYPGSAIPILKQINLKVTAGEFLVLTGGSGCGKTTITRIINGLGEKFYDGVRTGKVEVYGEPIANYPLYEMGKIVGSIFQDPKSQFFASITEDEVAFGCENYGLPSDEIDLRVNQAIQDINGNMLCEREIHPMSGGEKQKIAVASIHAVRPSIYVFDEPSANLDMKSVEALRKLMQALKQEGHTIVVAEHRIYYLAELADRFVYMKNGWIEHEWKPEEVRSFSVEKRKVMGIRSFDFNKIVSKEMKINKADEILSVNKLSCAYKKKPIFNNISFSAYAGDVIALVGHNGVGKSSLAKILCGVKKESAGTILVSGKKIPRRKRKAEVYYVMQNTDCQLFSDSVTKELTLSGWISNEIQAEDILKQYGLYEQREVHPATLSGGQKQRLTLAVAEGEECKILILDEPTSGLDYQNMSKVSSRISDMSKQGKIILIITHDYEFASITCNRFLYVTEESAQEYDVAGHLKELFECMSK
jgi:energy-coupling factor transporter ATP-binding protein EcfA2